ncbi:MAG: single-stranded DNA-binding protein [Bacilli bacterium]
MINRVVLVGRLTRDPELRKTNSGNSVCSFSVAVDNRQKNPDGTKSASFIPCVAFSQSADSMSKFTRKGSLVGIEGRLNQRSYQRQDGTKASVLEVLCDSVQFLEPKSAMAVENGDTPNDVSQVENEGKNLDSLDLPDDDLPF